MPAPVQGVYSVPTHFYTVSTIRDPPSTSFLGDLGNLSIMSFCIVIINNVYKYL